MMAAESVDGAPGGERARKRAGTASPGRAGHPSLPMAARAWRAEWTKTWSLPALRLVALGVVIAAPLVAFLVARADPPGTALDAVGVLAAGCVVFAASAAGAEFRDGQLAAGLGVVPRRGAFLAGKTASLVATALVAAVGLGLCALVERAVRPGPGVVPWQWVGALVYVTAMGAVVWGFTLAARAAAVPLALVLGLMLGGSALLSLLGPFAEVARWLPDAAGRGLFTRSGGAGLLLPAPAVGLSPGQAALVLGLWTAAAAASAAWRMRRDPPA